ncbi:DEAD/DEAH box helicase [Paraburkholderia sp. BL23I1N1]|uniref:DEAD/DEAH box helicase n=1 Tax=Paraburkholderia sp. BL23I1N1 TaxID=1938802 RepID=UPI00217DE86C|nr:DEAD/DEAH box helicase [Paraburkholderia sp. BL23I1N1]
MSASAPTESGKTFVVMQWLIEQMRSPTTRAAVYLAPTRALVSDIEGYLRAVFNTAAQHVES